MEGEEEGGLRLSKRFSDKGENGEVDYKTKSGTAWSHSFLNQKPWHPLSYPNQRRKWIAEQIHAQHDRRAEEIAREYAQEQEFFRQSALISKKEKEKIEMMKAVSFMYVRPPGFNPESAKAAEIADERKKEDQNNPPPAVTEEASSSMAPDSLCNVDQPAEVKKKRRPKDIYGRPLPTEEEFEVLKNAPRLDTGVAARSKPFAVEVRNVKCVRCGTFGHQSGDRECPLKDLITPNEENRLKRDDPLTAIMAHTDPSEPLKWELKQRPGMSPPRGGFNPDDPNQQIVADEIFDEYGGFLGGEIVPDLLSNLITSGKLRKKKPSKKRKLRGQDTPSSASDDESRRPKRKEKKHKKKQRNSESASSDEADFGRQRPTSKEKKLKKIRSNAESASSDELDFERRRPKSKEKKQLHDYESASSSDSERRRPKRKEDEPKDKQNDSESTSSGHFDTKGRRYRKRIRSRERWRCSSEDPPSDSDKRRRAEKDNKRHSADKHYYHKSKKTDLKRRSYPSASEDDADRQQSRYERSRREEKHSYHHRPSSSEDSEPDIVRRHTDSKSSRHRRHRHR